MRAVPAQTSCESSRANLDIRHRRFLIVFADFLEVRVDEIVGSASAPGCSPAAAPASPCALYMASPSFIDACIEFVRLGLDSLDVLAFERRTSARRSRPRSCSLSAVETLSPYSDDRLLGRVDQRLALVLGVDQPRDASCRRRHCSLGILHHLVDVGVRQPARCLDADLLFLVGRLVLRRHVDDTVGVDVEGHLRSAVRRAAAAGRPTRSNCPSTLLSAAISRSPWKTRIVHGGLTVLCGREQPGSFSSGSSCCGRSAGVNTPTQRLDAQATAGSRRAAARPLTSPWSTPA